jgi:hypothetical protein
LWFCADYWCDGRGRRKAGLCWVESREVESMRDSQWRCSGIVENRRIRKELQRERIAREYWVKRLRRLMRKKRSLGLWICDQFGALDGLSWMNMLCAQILGLWGISITRIATECALHRCYRELDESPSELPLTRTWIKKNELVISSQI